MTCSTFLGFHSSLPPRAGSLNSQRTLTLLILELGDISKSIDTQPARAHRSRAASRGVCWDPVRVSQTTRAGQPRRTFLLDRQVALR